MKRQLIAVLLCLSMAVIGPFTYPALAGSEVVEQVILVLWHGLDWATVHGLQFGAPLALGFLNTRSEGGEALSASYLSIGAGARAVGLGSAAVFYADEVVGKELYTLHTGLEPTALVQPKIAQMQAAQNVNYKMELGALGNAFAEAGVPLRVLGNSDGLDVFSWAALVGMDGWGRVWLGSVGSEFTIMDAEYPYGLRTDYTRLYAEVVEAEEPLVVVDLGDPFRYDQYQNQFMPAQKEIIGQKMAEEARLFLKSVVESRSPQTVVLLVSPYPSQFLASRGYWLTPILSWGQTEGLVISGTTRWPGLITNMDIAPTILNILAIDHNQPFIGRPASIEPLPLDEAIDWLETMGDMISVLSQYRGQVLRALVIGQILAYTAVLIALIVNVTLPQWAVRLLQVALLLLLVAPLGLLLWEKTPLGVLTLMFGIVMLKYKMTSSTRLIGAISITTALTIMMDVFLGSWLMRYSFLGYDPIGGARFYGIGNEFMGVLIGSAIMGWATMVEGGRFLQHRRNALGPLFFGILTVVIGAPSLGTNVGGAISAVFGFGSTWIASAGKKVSFRTVLVLGAVTVVVLGALMLVDGANSQGEQSHIGQTVELVRRDGLTALFLIITRKLAMNLKLLRYSMWSYALIVALVGMGASFIWPSSYIAWLKENHPFIAKGIVGVVISASAAFIFNDSGVVAAATCLSFASSTLLLLALESKHNLVTPQSHIKDDGYSNEACEHDASSGGNE